MAAGLRRVAVEQEIREQRLAARPGQTIEMQTIVFDA